MIDPALDGAFAVDPSARDFASPITARPIHLDAYIPRDGSPDAHVPLLFAPESGVPATSYAQLAQRTASYGIATFVVVYEEEVGAPNHVRNATDLLSALDFVRADAGFGSIDPTRVVFGGHGLGAKVAVLAARSSEGVAALVLLDPVDHVTGCLPQYCPDGPDVIAQITAPVLIFGDTEDGAACAPEAEGFDAFFARSASPAVRVIANGASLMSFVDDRLACGAPCASCAPSSADDAAIAAMTRAIAAAHLLVHVEGRAEITPYVAGDLAEARYVTTGIASIEAK